MLGSVKLQQKQKECRTNHIIENLISRLAAFVGVLDRNHFEWSFAHGCLGLTEVVQEMLNVGQDDVNSLLVNQFNLSLVLEDLSPFVF